MIEEKVDHKHPRFPILCERYNIQHPSTIHHFELDSDGTLTIVGWDVTEVLPSSRERVLSHG